MKKRDKNLIIIVLVTFIFSVISVAIILNLDAIRPYSWDTDPKRLEFPESVSNITLIIDYGPSNGTIERYENITLIDHYTTPFDLINKYSSIEYRIYWQGETAVFYVSSINSLSETNLYGWNYRINDQYALGANTISITNNSVVRWFYNG